MKIEELKMYQGTGLLMQNKMGFKLKFTGLDTMTRRVRLNMDWYTESELAHDGIKPLVKSLFNISDEDKMDLSEFDLEQFENNFIMWDVQPNIGSLCWGVNFERTMFLISKHYDIFNWLGNDNIKNR